MGFVLIASPLPAKISKPGNLTGLHNSVQQVNYPALSLIQRIKACVHVYSGDSAAFHSSVGNSNAYLHQNDSTFMTSSTV